MPGSTARLALPYPVLTDAADIQLVTQPLAERLDAIGLAYTKGTLGARPAANTMTDRVYYATDAGIMAFSDGANWQRLDLDAINRIVTLEAAGVDTDTRLDALEVATGVLAWNAAWPAAPVDGQIVDRWADAATTVIWRFRYVAAGATYKWQFIGGPSLKCAGNAGASIAVKPKATQWTKLNGAYACGVSGRFRFDVSANFLSLPVNEMMAIYLSIVATATATDAAIVASNIAQDFIGLAQNSAVAGSTARRELQADAVAGTTVSMFAAITIGAADGAIATDNVWVTPERCL